MHQDPFKVILNGLNIFIHFFAFFDSLRECLWPQWVIISRMEGDVLPFFNELFQLTRSNKVIFFEGFCSGSVEVDDWVDLHVGSMVLISFGRKGYFDIVLYNASPCCCAVAFEISKIASENEPLFPTIPS